MTSEEMLRADLAEAREYGDRWRQKANDLADELKTLSENYDRNRALWATKLLEVQTELQSERKNVITLSRLEQSAVEALEQVKMRSETCPEDDFGGGCTCGDIAEQALAGTAIAPVWNGTPESLAEHLNSCDCVGHTDTQETAPSRETE